MSWQIIRLGPRMAALVFFLALPVVLVAQDQPRAIGATDADAPLPPGAMMRLGETRFRPGARIKHLAFSPDGQQLAAWGNWLYFEDRLSVWDVATGRELHTQSVAERQIVDLCWGPNGRGFAALKAGNGFRVWSFGDPTDKPPPPVGRMMVIGVAQPPGAPTYSRLALSPDGSRLAVFRSAGDPAGAAVELLEAKASATVTNLNRVAVRDSLPTGKCTGLHFVRGGQAVVVLTESQVKGEHLVVVWDVEKGTVSDPVPVAVGVAQGERYSLDVATDGSAVAIGLEDGTIKVYDLPTGKERLSVRKHDGPKHGGPWSEVSAVKFVNDGRNVLSAGRDGRQLVWDAKTGIDVAVLNGHVSWVEAVAIAPDGRCVATAGQDSLIRLWDTATWRPILAPHGPRESVWRLEVARDGKYAAAGSGDGVHVWELASGREVRTIASDYRSGHIVFAPEGGVLTGSAGGDLSLVPIPAGAPQPLAAKGRLLNFTPDGKTLLTAQGNSLLAWDWPECTQRRSVAVSSPPLSAAIAHDNRTAVLGLEGKGASAVIDLESGDASEMPLKLHWFAHAAGFADGDRLVCGTTGGARAEVWSLATRSLVRPFEQPPQRQPAGQFYQLSFAVSPDGRRAASCHSDGGVSVYEVATGQVLAHFVGHRESVIALAWTPDGRRLLSGGGDHQVLVWDASLRALAGAVDSLSATDRRQAWDTLGTQSAKDALRTIAALAADPNGTVALLAEMLKPVPTTDAAILDRIFRDLDDDRFVVRAKAVQELSNLGAGALAGVRQRAAQANSAEVRQRAAEFLKRFEGETPTPDRVRIVRALDILATVNTPAARRVVETLAGGAPDVWETDVARQALRSW